MFDATKSFLNPKFEGYKLHPVAQQDVVTIFPLQYKPTQATVSNKSPFSFQEIQSRITHNHLAVCDGTQRSLYVDLAFKVIMIDIDADVMSPTFHVIFELPKPVQSVQNRQGNHEYPSAAFISQTQVLVADGHGLMYTLHISDNGASELLGTFSLPGESTGPFRVHSAHSLTPTTYAVVLSSRNYNLKQDSGTQPKRSSKPTPAVFDVWGAKVDHSIEPHNDIRELEILWHRRGQGVPIYTTYSEPLRSFLVLGETSYHPVGHIPASPYEPSPDEIAPVPRPDENLEDNGGPVKPPAYSWTQTSDSITIAVPLPSDTPKPTIRVEFSPTALTFYVTHRLSTPVPIPQFSARKLWDGISPSSSYWTWDREADRSFGLLTLYLDKQHEGTKWPQIFSSDAHSKEDIEVLETLDPSELWHVREALEKYTAALTDGEDASGLGLGRGVPSLAEGELDMEVDETVGRNVHLSWVGEQGSIPPWYQDKEDIPFKLLSTPIPGISDTEVSLVIKNGIDGIVFTLGTPNSQPVWTHTSTFSALSFVLASKRDTRFTLHSSRAVLALEGGGKDRGGNVYIYYSTGSNEKWAKQTLFKVGSGIGGSLLGVGAIKLGESAPALVCLTEGELVIIRKIWLGED